MEKLKVMKETLEEALDQINSSRSSSDARTLALQSIERCLAEGLAGDERSLEHFLALQYTFECNVPLRLLSWLGHATTQLDTLAKGRVDEHVEREVNTLTSQIVSSLSLIQGIALSHPNSKVFLARRYPQEVILDLLLASRHLPLSSSNNADTNECRKQGSTEPPLTSLVLDTLLCILVDSSAALRMFEIVGGPQAVVRILKRATTPREVRMKCLEFLYFYLLDETTPTSEGKEKIREDLEQASPQKPPPVPTRPSTPVRAPSSKPRLTAAPLRPASASFTSSMSSVSSSSSGGSSRSASNSSTMSFSSTSSASTTASSIASSPEKPSALSRSDPPPPPRSPEKRPTSTTPKGLGPTKHAQVLGTPPSSPPPLDPIRSKYKFPRTPAPSLSVPDAPRKSSTKLQPKAKPATALSPKAAVHPATTAQSALQPRAMMMLKRDVEYEPLSPEKPILGISSTSNSTSSNGSHGGRAVPSTPLPKSTTSTPGHVKSKSTSVLGGGRPSGGGGGTLSRQREARRDIRESLGREAGKGYVKSTRLHSAESVRAESGFKASFLEGRGLPSSMSPLKAEVPSGASPEKGKARDRGEEERERRKEGERERERKTTEEKKQLLGTMLGNVDALVEGVRKAGIWGLA
ncbi:cell division control protein 14, SIN component-domain-containing protein [Coprinopsis sp. MPI-PUGE-AT-0042]|nr:cell division control protein 14, SIN component-domain-containing protein [Coprinopsis sp. MPI-PUGE-AT-0042]